MDAETLEISGQDLEKKNYKQDIQIVVSILNYIMNIRLIIPRKFLGLHIFQKESKGAWVFKRLKREGTELKAETIIKAKGREKGKWKRRIVMILRL